MLVSSSRAKMGFDKLGFYVLGWGILVLWIYVANWMENAAYCGFMR